MKRAGTVLLVVMLLTSASAGCRLRDDAAVDADSHTPRPGGRGAFPIAWYDTLEASEKLPDIRRTGMNAVLPYHSATASITRYLDMARESGIDVWLEIDRALFDPPNAIGAASFVSRHKSHRAVAGWYLADEPALTDELEALTPDVAGSLYRAIKAEDPDHPVAIAFGVSDEPDRYRDAMDVMMFDDYPCVAGRDEFAGLDGWFERLRRAGDLAVTESGFFPIIQAFSSDDYRLPTAREERYMVYAALQAGATGLFFWTRYRATNEWVDSILEPLVDEVSDLSDALASRELPGVSSSDRRDVITTVFRDPVTRKALVIVVHHGRGTVSAMIKLDPSLDADTGEELDVRLGPYAARVFELN